MTVMLTSIFFSFVRSHLTVVRVDDLEVLDGGLGDTSMEVEHV